MYKAAGGRIEGVLHYAFYMTSPAPQGHIVRGKCDNEKVPFDSVVFDGCSIDVNGKRFICENKSLFFENILTELSVKMKEEYPILSCFTCQFSEYSPYGNDDFGDMLCYGRYREECLKVNDKDGFFEYLENKDCGKRQEIYLCSDHEFRDKAEGYWGFVEGLI
ncbi:MAG: hypothetical protein NC078_05485 [Ruminococcus sp.]|nr:hypothetical protein [Ruminococcus sp.]